MSDLVSGRYPQLNPLFGLLGGLANVANPTVPARTNAEYLSYGTMTDGALANSGVGCFVPVFVDVGMVVSKVSILVGATAASTPTHQFAALYSGTGTAPALIGQSTDTTTAAIAASVLYGWSLTTATVITTAMAPNGFLYVLVSITGTTIPTAFCQGTPAGVNYQWNGTTSPLLLSGTTGSALAGTAPATIVTGGTAKTVAPLMFLT